MSIVQTAFFNGAGNEISASFGSPVSDGNAILLMFLLMDYAASDPAGNGQGLSGDSLTPPDKLFDEDHVAYTLLQIRAPLDATNNNIEGVYFYSRYVPSGGPQIITLHGSSFRGMTIGALELSGRGPVLSVGVNLAPVNSSGFISNPSTALNGVSDNEDVIALHCWDGTGTDTSFTAGSGYTKLGPSSNSTFGMQYRNFPTAGNYTLDATLGSNQASTMVALGIKALATSKQPPKFSSNTPGKFSSSRPGLFNFS